LLELHPCCCSYTAEVFACDNLAHGEQTRIYFFQSLAFLFMFWLVEM
jgi:hypothetical protein